MTDKAAPERICVHDRGNRDWHDVAAIRFDCPGDATLFVRLDVAEAEKAGYEAELSEMREALAVYGIEDVLRLEAENRKLREALRKATEIREAMIDDQSERMAEGFDAMPLGVFEKWLDLLGDALADQPAPPAKEEAHEDGEG